MRTAWIISIGTELTLGQSVDTNAVWLSAQLAKLGVRCTQRVTLPDELRACVQAFQQASATCDVVLITGGLGPTADDLTREALAQAAGAELASHAGSLEQIKAFFAQRGREMPPANAVQALFPSGAEPIANPTGTAPGIHMRLGSAEVFALPGVPSEMKPMFERDVAPRLGGGDGLTLRSVVLRCHGLGESEIGQRLADLMVRGRNPEVGTTAEQGMVGVRINSSGPGPDVDRMLGEVERLVRERLGDHVYGRDDETLAQAVGELLRRQGATLATAESCTGGWIGKLLTDAAGSSDYYLGGVVAYADKLKQVLLDVPEEALRRHGAVSDVVAKAMAEGARGRFAADYALSVTGVAGPGGGSVEKPVGSVFIGLATPTLTRAHKRNFGADSPRDSVRIRSASAALDLLRRELLSNGR